MFICSTPLSEASVEKGSQKSFHKRYTRQMMHVIKSPLKHGFINVPEVIFLGQYATRIIPYEDDPMVINIQLMKRRIANKIIILRCEKNIIVCDDCCFFHLIRTIVIVCDNCREVEMYLHVEFVI